MAPRAEKNEVFRKVWNFANHTYFVSCIMRKYYFLLWMKETVFFPCFYRGIIFYSVELFKFFLNFFIFLNINTNQHQRSNIWIKKQALISGSSYKEVLEVKCQVCNFTGVLSFASVFEDFGHIFPTCLLQNFK